MLSVMDKQFGLVFLLRIYLGIASNVVQPMQRHERKSIGAERYVFLLRKLTHEKNTHTFARTFTPVGEKEKILQKLDEVATALEKDMQRSGWTGRTLTLKFKLDTFQG
jgi:DNA polymerase kappa